MKNIVFLRNNTKALLKELFPTGRAWHGEDDSELSHKVKSDAIAEYLYEIETFVSSILPDNELFDEQDAINWERRLGLDYDPDSLTLDERKAEITRKLSFPGGYKNTLTLEFLEYQLRASSFDVRVYRNDELSQPAGTELIANSVDKEEGFTINNFYHTFIIAGETIDTQAVIESRRRNEFIRKVLRYKPMNMVCFLNSTVSKQDGTFKLKYSDYLCELIEETAPYATDVSVSGIKEVDKELTGSYTYNDDEGDPESGTTFKWYRSDDDTGTNRTEISGATGQTYTLTSDDANKYIQFAVIPANDKATGDEEMSDFYGPIDAKIIPVITEFLGGNTNTLRWTMEDGTEHSGTWYVEYSFNNSNWNSSSGSGSPREDVLPVGIYEQDMYFRVKRVSEPTTEYSEVFSVYVDEITNLTQEFSSPTNIVEALKSSPTGICTTGSETTASNIYLQEEMGPPSVGHKLWFKDSNGEFHRATYDNIMSYPSESPLGDFDSGIKWARFPNYTNDIWDVDPTTGDLTGISTEFSCE